MVKYYSYRSLLDRKKKIRNKKIKIFLFVISFIVVGILFKEFISKIKFTSLSEMFKIKNISIYSNTTTIPEDLIYEYLNKQNLSIFNFLKAIKKLKKLYPEIKNITYSGLFTKNPKLNIISFTPICYDKYEKDKLFSCESGWYKVYDLNKIDYSKIFEVEYKNYRNDEFLKNIFLKVNSLKLNNYVKKIYLENNSECYLLLNVGNGNQEILIDNSFYYTDEQKIAKLINFISNKNVKIYGKLISDGRVFIE